MPHAPRPRRRRAATLDTVLSPQSELPRGLLGQDRSRSRSTVQELTWAQFDGIIHALSCEIRATFDPDVVLGIAHGGLFVGAALASALGRPFHPVRISRRSRDTTGRRDPRLLGEMPVEVEDARVLLVDDVAASGDTLALARALAMRAGAREVRAATLLCRDEGFAPDWTVLVMDGPVVFPWDYGPVTEDGRFDVGPMPGAAPLPKPSSGRKQETAARRRRTSA